MAATPELERAYDDHAQALFAFLLNFTSSETDTRDVLQEVFCKLADRPGLLAAARDERAFLLRMAHNLAVDLMRRRATREQVASRLQEEQAGAFAPGGSPDEEALRQELASALAELSPEQRAVVHLKLWGGLTFDTIAETLDIPLNTAASRYRYGLDKLRERLRPIYEEMK